MANKSKIVGEIELKVRELCEKKYNPTYIGKQVGLAKDTVKAWALKNGFNLSNRLESKIIELRPQIESMLIEGKSRKSIQKALNVHFTQVTKIANEINLSHSLKTRKDSALQKILSREEVELRITDGSKYLGHDQNKNKYCFQCPRTDKIYYKSVGKIEQGSPYGKSGRKITEEEFANSLKVINHTLEKGTFTKTKAPVVVYCSKKHKRHLNKASYAFQFECAACSNNGTSKGEQDLLEWVRTYYPSATKFKFPERKTRPKEIDVFIPELNIGIEYCGLYYHTEKDIEAKDSKHYNKLLEANSLGIRLITVFENEWKDRNSQVKGFLLSAIQKNANRIYARECDVKEIEGNECNVFLDKYHIQTVGPVPRVAFGLFFKGELVGAMSGGLHPQRSSKKDKTLYLTRMAFKSDLTVVGGASKMFSAFKDYAKRNGFEKIISWSDNRWSEGNVYKYLGFQFDSQKTKGRGLSDGSIWPELFYVLNGQIRTREYVKKNGLDEDSLNKIYDCGKKRWSIDIT